MSISDTPARPCRPHLPWAVGAVAAVVALAFACYTGHAWEDYFITLRTSRNLVEGHGLVFQPGERLHAFTSPLGTLLPALTYWVADRSVQFGLWLFRLFSVAAFSMTAVLTWDTAARLRWPRVAQFLLSALLILDAKTVDFTINGMETAFLLLGLIMLVRGHVLHSHHPVLRLGGAIALLQWTRPDSFIYAGAVLLCFLVFPRAAGVADSRGKLFAVQCRAVVLALLFYAPWIIWAGWYYGSPIPHTIVAKGLHRVLPDWAGLVRTAVLHPLLGWSSSPLDAIYQPHYATIFGGWPAPVRWFSRALVWLASSTWLWPRASPVTRALSFGFYLSEIYVAYIPFLYPWYIPAPAFLASLACAAAWADAATWLRTRGRRWSMVLHCITVGVAVGALTLLLLTAQQMRIHQRLFETRMRAIGLWLRDHASSPRETVFLEPLGYIGFFSQLKMLDYPGLASSEVVEARRKVGDDWGTLLAELRPDWLVLRPWEESAVRQTAPRLLSDHYESVKFFDVRADFASVPQPFGAPFLDFDAVHTIYRRIR